MSVETYTTRAPARSARSASVAVAVTLTRRAASGSRWPAGTRARAAAGRPSSGRAAPAAPAGVGGGPRGARGRRGGLVGGRGGGGKRGHGRGAARGGGGRGAVRRGVGAGATPAPGPPRPGGFGVLAHPLPPPAVSGCVEG